MEREYFFDNVTKILSLSFRGLCYAFLLFGLLCGTMGIAAAQSSDYSASQIKVALVYKLMHFIGWPANTALNLCVYKPSAEDVDSFGLIPSKMESGQQLNVSLLYAKTYEKVYKNGNAFKQNNCHIIFFSRDINPKIQHILADIASDKVLTIGETSEFIKQGGMINLIRKDSMIKFEINLSALKKAELTISSQVLRIADKIHTENSYE